MMEPDPRVPAEAVMMKPWIQCVMLLIVTGRWHLSPPVKRA